MRYQLSKIKKTGISLILATIMYSGCSSTPPEYRAIDVQLPSGEWKRDVLVLTEEDTTTNRVQVICRTWIFTNGRRTSDRRGGRRPNDTEICGSQAFWASRTVAPQWIHPESGTADLAADERKCRTKAARWGSRSHRGVTNSTYEWFYNGCMEEKGYSLFAID